MSGFSDYYYAFVFIILALLQEEVKGFLSSLVCSSMMFMAESFFRFSNSIGMSFFETALLYDGVFFVIGLFIVSSRVGLVLISVTSISIIFNTICWTVYTEHSSFIQDYYGTVNIILFEILLYGHVTTTKIYPWIKTKSKIVTEGIKGKINNFFKRQRGEEV